MQPQTSVDPWGAALTVWAVVNAVNLLQTIGGYGSSPWRPRSCCWGRWALRCGRGWDEPLTDDCSPNTVRTLQPSAFAVKQALPMDSLRSRLKRKPLGRRRLQSGFLNPDSSCQSQFMAHLVLSFESRLTRRNRRICCPVSTPLAQTHLHQPHTGTAS
jgi:hypothetical protein